MVSSSLGNAGGQRVEDNNGLGRTTKHPRRYTKYYAPLPLLRQTLLVRMRGSTEWPRGPVSALARHTTYMYTIRLGEYSANV